MSLLKEQRLSYEQNVVEKRHGVFSSVPEKMTDSFGVDRFLLHI